MPKIEYRSDIAAILFASALTVLGVSAAHAGGALGGVINMKATHGAAAGDAAVSGTRHLTQREGIDETRRATPGAVRSAEDWPPPPKHTFTRNGGAKGGVID